MYLKKCITLAAAGVLLFGTMAATPATAQSNDSFTALQGLEVQVLTAREMAAISGELNAVDIANSLYDFSLRLTDGSRLQKSVQSLAQWYYDNRDKINALFDRFKILTPCVLGGKYSC